MSQRAIDWSDFLSLDAPQPTVSYRTASSDAGWLLSALRDVHGATSIDETLRRAVQSARQHIGLARASIFLRSGVTRLMQGTWGTDCEGSTRDEHDISFELSQDDLDLYEHSTKERVHWIVVDNAPLVVHSPTETHLVGRGWVCCTPILERNQLLALMFNDAGTTGARIDDVRQGRAAVLCSLLGTLLSRRRAFSSDGRSSRPSSPLVAAAVRMLELDPTLTAEALGTRLCLSPSRVARVFKREMGVSLVTFKNQLRLQRFLSALDQRDDNLLEAALRAGFGSYAQFHRVFLATHGMSPRAFLARHK